MWLWFGAVVHVDGAVCVCVWRGELWCVRVANVVVMCGVVVFVFRFAILLHKNHTNSK